MKHTRILFALAGAALIQTAAFAESVTYSQTFNFNSIPGSGTSSGQNYNYSTSYDYGTGTMWGGQFNSGLGSLLSMDFSIGIYSTMASHFTYAQPPAQVGPGSASEGWSVQYVRVGNLALDGRYLSSNNGLPSMVNTPTIPVGGSVDSNLLLQGTVTSHITDPSLLNDFIQGTAFYVDMVSRYTSSSQYAMGGGSNPNLQMQVSYTFNYAPAAVPEPSTIALLGLAGISVLAIRRRNAHK